MSKHQQIEIDAQQSDASQSEARPPWGEQLRETRVRRGMSIEEVSSVLHLELSLLEAIETENCDRLPGSSYVKGYLRNYAKLLEVDSEPLIEAYRKVCGNQEPPLTQVTKIKDVSSGDAAPRYAAWIVVIVLVVSFGVWWWSEVSAPMEVESTASDTPSFGPQIDASPQPETAFTPPPPGAAVPESEPAPSAEGPIESEPQGVAPAAVPPAPSEPPAAAPVLDSVQLSFTEDSWVEIEDARGERLFVDLARAGQTTRVQGEAPFEILLGNAPAVTIEYNGEVYPHAAHNRQGVARFTLGE
ncbi:hypothetical protein Tel_11015 [Candidatus Tenderia electrophaga]|jgi:cytoskeleton protein RodZ|uniref:Cytoskeleton protein RodZ-like C-terminal domain-containing protein n=1 Tax=Candidatus Tenderia electrophaga TaxID=1748243 RepID=A0A0S2TER8_9GAMM|nr:hypothetical protein Tel_11015 [Candidatus Tenderia electrophaga]